MAHWDDEVLRGTVPPKDIPCSTCKYKLRPVTVGNYTQDRSGYLMCDKYATKPIGIVWGRCSCYL